jgi:hypothetical protein
MPPGKLEGRPPGSEEGSEDGKPEGRLPGSDGRLLMGPSPRRSQGESTAKERAPKKETPHPRAERGREESARRAGSPSEDLRSWKYHELRPAGRLGGALGRAERARPRRLRRTQEVFRRTRSHFAGGQGRTGERGKAASLCPGLAPREVSADCIGHEMRKSDAENQKRAHIGSTTDVLSLLAATASMHDREQASCLPSSSDREYQWFGLNTSPRALMYAGDSFPHPSQTNLTLIEGCSLSP